MRYEELLNKIVLQTNTTVVVCQISFVLIKVAVQGVGRDCFEEPSLIGPRE